MKRPWLTRGLAVSSACSLAGLIAAFASCATNTEEEVAPPSATIPEASTPNNADAGDPDAEAPSPDGGCDAGDPSCNAKVVSCDEVDWCMATTPGPLMHPLLSVWGSGASDVWAVGTGGTILHYDGAQWRDTSPTVKNTFYTVWGTGPNNVWVASSTSVLLHGDGFHNSTGTATWTNEPTGLEYYSEVPIRAMWGTGPNDIRLGARAYDVSLPPPVYYGMGNQFVRTTAPDGGASWRSITGSAVVRGYWGSSAADVWMVGDNSIYASAERGLIMHGTPSDAGADAGGLDDTLTWKSIDSQSNVTLESIWGSSANDVWAVGATGTIRHITQSDIRWQKVASPTISGLHQVWGSGPNDIWVVGDSGTILHWDGTSFTDSSAQFPIGKKPSLYGVWGTGPNDVWIVGDKIVLHYTGPKGANQ